jgi:hypothetical protein
MRPDAIPSKPGIDARSFEVRLRCLSGLSLMWGLKPSSQDHRGRADHPVDFSLSGQNLHPRLRVNGVTPSPGEPLCPLSKCSLSPPRMTRWDPPATAAVFGWRNSQRPTTPCSKEARRSCLHRLRAAQCRGIPQPTGRGWRGTRREAGGAAGGPRLGHRFLADESVMQTARNSPALGCVDPGSFDAVFLSGGYGPMWDAANDELLAQVIRPMFDQGKLVAAV